jgi:hypothetical protein
VCRANDPQSLLSVDGDDADQAIAAVLRMKSIARRRFRRLRDRHLRRR